MVDKAGRKVLLIISGSVMAFSSALIATFFLLKQNDIHQSLEFIPLTGLVIFMIGYSIGYASVPFVVMGELFPSQFRSLMGGISSSINLTHTFLVIKLFTNLETLFGLYGVFFTYAACSLVGCLFVIIFLPETKGKTLDEIESHFKKREWGTQLIAIMSDIHELKGNQMA